MRAPLIKDKLFFGVSGTSEQMDGYNTNDFLDKKVDRRRGLNGRMQLRWMPTDKLDVTANVDGEKVNDGVFPLTDMDQADKNPHHVSYNYEGRDKRDTLGSSLRVAYDAPWFKVTSITAYRGYNDVTRNDQDFMPYDLITAKEDIKDRQFTQEFRVRIARSLRAAQVARRAVPLQETSGSHAGFELRAGCRRHGYGSDGDDQRGGFGHQDLRLRRVRAGHLYTVRQARSDRRAPLRV